MFTSFCHASQLNNRKHVVQSRHPTLMNWDPLWPSEIGGSKVFFVNIPRAMICNQWVSEPSIVWSQNQPNTRRDVFCNLWNLSEIKFWDAHQQSSPEIHFYDERISINLYFPPASWEGGIPGKIPISYLRWISEPSGVSESVSINLHDTRQRTQKKPHQLPVGLHALGFHHH